MEDDFLIIGFTKPDEWQNASEEAYAIIRYLESEATDLFHIRKTEASLDYTRRLLLNIPESFYKKLVLHSHFSLFEEFPLKGVHFKPGIPGTMRESVISRSCHSVEECNVCHEGYLYSFLSPIFDSISKPGYYSNFKLHSSLLSALNKETKVIGLGGVTPDNFQNLFNSKFAGAALLGYLWSPKLPQEVIMESINNARSLLPVHN